MAFVAVPAVIHYCDNLFRWNSIWIPVVWSLCWRFVASCHSMGLCGTQYYFVLLGLLLLVAPKQRNTSVSFYTSLNWVWVLFILAPLCFAIKYSLYWGLMSIGLLILLTMNSRLMPISVVYFYTTLICLIFSKLYLWNIDELINDPWQWDTIELVWVHG